MLASCMPRFGRRIALSVASTNVSNAFRFAFLTLIVIAATMPHALGQTPSLQVVKTISLGTSPFGSTLSPDGQTVWVSNGKYSSTGDFVTGIDVKTLNTLPEKIAVGQFPQEIAFSRRDSSKAFVTNSTSSSISVVNTKTSRVSQVFNLPAGYPFGIAVSLDDKRIVVTSQSQSQRGGVTVLSNTGAGLRVAGNIPIPGVLGRVAVIAPTRFMNVAERNSSAVGKMLVPSYAQGTAGPPVLNLIDPATAQTVKTLSLEGSHAVPQAVVVSPDGRFAYVTLFSADIWSLNLVTGSGGVWVVDLKTFTSKGVISTGDERTFAADITRDGKYLFVTNFVKNEVVAMDTATNKVVARTSVGLQPVSITLSDDGKLAFVANQNASTVSVIAVSLPGQTVASLN